MSYLGSRKDSASRASAVLVLLSLKAYCPVAANGAGQHPPRRSLVYGQGLHEPGRHLRRVRRLQLVRALHHLRDRRPRRHLPRCRHLRVFRLAVLHAAVLLLRRPAPLQPPVPAQVLHRHLPVPVDMAPLRELRGDRFRRRHHLDGAGQLPDAQLDQGDHLEELGHLLGHAAVQHVLRQHLRHVRVPGEDAHRRGDQEARLFRPRKLMSDGR